MMSISSLVEQLATQGIQLWPDGDQLRYRAEEHALTSDLMALLKENKAKIIEYFKHDYENCALSYGQKGLWFEYQIAPEDYRYNVSFALRLHSEVDLKALQQAFQHLVNRHPALRTIFTLSEGTPVQNIHRYEQVNLNVIDASRWTEAFLHEQVTSSHELPFDLTQRPLFRLHLWTRHASDHVLLWTMHHLICDGWSCWMMLDELRLLYSAALSGDLSPMSLATSQKRATYADYVDWQAKMLQTEGDHLWGFWRTQLSGELPILNLPTDHARTATPTYQGDSILIEIPSHLTDALRLLAQKEGVTLYMLLLAAFQVLLYRYSGQDDILVGSPIAGRSHPDFVSTVGYFVNPIGLRANLADHPTFSQFLQQVRGTVLAAMKHQDFPFQQLVERLQPSRPSNVTPIFQVMFGFHRSQSDMQNTALARQELSHSGAPTVVEWDGLTLSSYYIPQFEGMFDLYLEVFDQADTLSGTLKYNSALFESETIQRMVAHLHILLTGIVAENPLGVQQPITELPLLTEAERHQLLVEWNDTATDYPADKCIHQLFEEQVVRTPNAIALVFQDEQLTYHELNIRANQLAHYLIAQGVGPDVLVGICIPRSIEMVVGLLGILKAGGACVPLDPTYPRKRLEFMLQDAKVNVLLTDDNGMATLPDNEALTVNLAHIPATRKTNPTHNGNAKNFVYVLYTSGSTGRPKGVAMPHRTLCNLIDWQRSMSDGTGRTLQFAPMNFDVSWQDFFSTWCFGGILVLINEEMRRDPFALLTYLKQQAINRLFLPFTPLQQLAEAANGEMPPSLREVITAGERLQITTAIADWFRDSQSVLHNQYGPTESHVVTAYQLTGEVDDWPILPSIGTPIANTQMYILDPHLQPVPIGVLGELYIGGLCLAQGYLNRPQLTSERFIPNPFGPGRLYKTGDLCRYLPDGNIEFLGRADYQVKIRGFRIELGEIEAVLNKQPNVREAVVVTVDSGEESGAGKRLVAYVVGVVERLRNKLSQQLPAYMIPSTFVQLEAMPLTPNGKIDRRALPAPDMSALLSEDSFVPPSTPTEIALANIWSEVLGIEQIGIHDNFFELGGHSLLATQIVSRMRDMLQIEVSLNVFFEYPTISSLLAQIRMMDTLRRMSQSNKIQISEDTQKVEEEW